MIPKLAELKAQAEEYSTQFRGFSAGSRRLRSMATTQLRLIEALELAIRQRDEEIDLHTTFGNFSANGKDGHNAEITKILEGKAT